MINKMTACTLPRKGAYTRFFCCPAGVPDITPNGLSRQFLLPSTPPSRCARHLPLHRGGMSGCGTAPPVNRDIVVFARFFPGEKAAQLHRAVPPVIEILWFFFCLLFFFPKTYIALRLPSTPPSRCARHLPLHRGGMSGCGTAAPVNRDIVVFLLPTFLFFQRKGDKARQLTAAGNPRYYGFSFAYFSFFQKKRRHSSTEPHRL